MYSRFNEIRDPIYAFVAFDDQEKEVLNSPPVQRLRRIHQLALQSWVYPGATHSRIEHSLGVMELATRVYNVVTNPENVHPEIRRLMPNLNDPMQVDYYRRVIRMAALCHDIGHLPFSHAAEKELLPTGWTHETVTRNLICSTEMKEIWARMRPPLIAEDVAKLAVGAEEITEADGPMSDWETILSEVIVGDSFGVDRMDYLLRDSHHLGVAYGRFDHFRLIDTLRILPKNYTHDGSLEPALGLEQGGLHAAESLLLARYFMFTQVYLHHTRRAYDILLKQFMNEWLPGGKVPTTLEEFLLLNDDQVMSAMDAAAVDSAKPGHEPARRILKRQHYRVVYESNPSDIDQNPDATTLFYEGLMGVFGTDHIHRDTYLKDPSNVEFPVQTRGGDIQSSLALSDPLRNIPPILFDSIFAPPEMAPDVRNWINENRPAVLKELATE